MKIFDKIFARTAQKKKIAKTMRRIFAAAQQNRLTGDWITAPLSIDQEISDSLTLLRNRSRELSKNNAYARNFLRKVKQNVIGPHGFSLQVDIIDEDGKRDKQTSQRIESAFADWARRENCSVSQRMSWTGVQGQLVVGAARDGESIARKVIDPSFKYGFRLQLIEPEALDERYNDRFTNGNIVKMGVEFDVWRKPIRYWFRVMSDFNSVSTERRPFAAEDIVHAFEQEYPHQTRGIPWIVSSMLATKMLGAYEEAALVNARVAAAKMGFIETAEGALYVGDSRDVEGNDIKNVAPGTVEKLPPGTKFSAFEPEFPTSEHEPFWKASLKSIAAGYGISFNTLAGDYESVNYSSMRAAFLEERDFWRDVQRWCIEQLLDPIFIWWIDAALLSGDLKIPYSRWQDVIHARWIGRRWEWVDPLRDAEAEIVLIAAGLKSRTDSLAERGTDIGDLYEKIKEEIELENQMGLTFDVSKVAGSLPSLDEQQKKPRPKPANGEMQLDDRMILARLGIQTSDSAQLERIERAIESLAAEVQTMKTVAVPVVRPRLKTITQDIVIERDQENKLITGARVTKTAVEEDR